jgi:hypothetical protein
MNRIWDYCTIILKSFSVEKLCRWLICPAMLPTLVLLRKNRFCIDKNRFLTILVSIPYRYRLSANQNRAWLQPYTIGKFPSDPTFSDCSTSFCQEAWALRMLNSSSIFIYSAGFYSFFQNYDQACVPEENCQEKLIETSSCTDVWVYNIFTKGVVEIASPDGYVHWQITSISKSWKWNDSWLLTVVCPLFSRTIRIKGILSRENSSDCAG